MNTGTTGWLNPDGKFYECESWEHMYKAEEIVKEYGYVKSKCTEEEEEVLLRNGWIRISFIITFFHGFTFGYIRKPTQEQLNFLKPYLYGEYGFPVEEFDRKQLMRELGETE